MYPQHAVTDVVSHAPPEGTQQRSWRVGRVVYVPNITSVLPHVAPGDVTSQQLGAAAPGVHDALLRRVHSGMLVHTPAAQLVPGHVFPHTPQLAGSVSRSTHVLDTGQYWGVLGSQPHSSLARHV
jgi:hypothetical protein